MYRFDARPTALIAALLAASLGAASLGGTTRAATKKSTAPTPPAGGPPLAGTVVSGSKSRLTIKPAGSKSTTIVDLTAQTHYLINGKSTSKAPSWKKGEQVQVIGTKEKNGHEKAQAVFVGKPPAGAGPGGTPPSGAPPAGARPGGPPPGSGAQVNGKAVSISGSSLTVKTSSGSHTTVRLTSSTQYLVNGKPVTKRPTFKPGQTIHVALAKSSKNAQMVAVGALPSAPAPPAG